MKQDSTTVDRIFLLHPSLVEEAKAIYVEIVQALSGRAVCRFTHTLRTFAEQDALYAIGRSVKGSIVTNAKGGESYHNYGLAIDICLLVDKDGNGSFETASWDGKTDFDGDNISDWQEIVKIFKMYGWEWGGDWKFKDTPHFQKTFGCSIKQLQHQHTHKHVDGKGYVILPK